MSTPSHRPPAGVPESGGTAKYAILAVVLVLGIGAIFAWRHLSTPAPATPPPVPSVPSVQASAEPPPNPKLDDIPLPPPPEEKPEGGAGPHGASGAATAAAGGGCEATCTGTAPPELAGALQIRAMQARHRCYERALLQNSSLRGHVTIAVRVGPGGNVCSASVAANDMGTPGVASCAAGIFQSAGGLPAPKGGCVTASVPISFVPQGQ
jgi:outer membrane biosynthesis protein TonB